MRDWMEQKIFLGYLQQINDVCSTILDSDENFVWSSCGNDKSQFQQLWKDTITHCKQVEDLESPFVYEAQENIYIWVLLVENNYYLFGPVGSKRMTWSQLHAFCHNYHLKYDKMYIPTFPISKMLEVMRFSLYATAQIELSLTEMMYLNKKIFTVDASDKTNYDLFRLNEEKERVPYEVERRWLEKLKNGNITDDEEIKQFSFESVGKMAENSDYKQIEYMYVGGITLATRAIIEGGVQPEIAYKTSDILLQKLSKAQNINDLMKVGFQYVDTFSDLVLRYKKKREKGVIVERCKDYIAKHLYKKFTIQQMADNLTINCSHMSRTFSERAGVTITNYIRDERLRAGANLLRYSEESVAQISDYLHFSSPSRFSIYFKQKYNVTPLQFREENKVIEFISKER